MKILLEVSADLSSYTILIWQARLDNKRSKGTESILWIPTASLGENELRHIRIDRQNRITLCGVTTPLRVLYLHNLERMRRTDRE